MNTIDASKILEASEKYEKDELATPQDITKFKSAIGQMLFIGRLSNPIMLYFASHMATKSSALHSHHLKQLGSIIRHIKRQPHNLTFKVPNPKYKSHIDVYSDASPPSNKDLGSRGGYIIYRRFGDITHPIMWQSRKLRRVARSSSTAEILAAASAVDMGIFLREVIAELTGDDSVTVELTTDSRSVFNLVTSTKMPEENANRVDLAAMREYFEKRKLHAVNWCPGYYIVADALTKDNRTIAALLLKSMREGTYPIHADTLRRTCTNGITEGHPGYHGMAAHKRIETKGEMREHIL